MFTYQITNIGIHNDTNQGLLECRKYEMDMIEKFYQLDMTGYGIW